MKKHGIIKYNDKLYSERLVHMHLSWFNLIGKLSCIVIFITAGCLIASFCYAQPKLQNICRILGADATYEACPFPSVWKGNSFDVYDLNTGKTHKTYFDTNFSGARSDPGVAPVPIHAFDKCYYVDNFSKLSIFVPFSTDAEWAAFLNNLPVGISLRACTLRAVYISASTTSKGDHAVFSLPTYSVAGEEQTMPQYFGYYEPQHCDNSNQCLGPWEWTETITARFRAGSPTWTLVDESVSGGPPDMLSSATSP